MKNAILIVLLSEMIIFGICGCNKTDVTSSNGSFTIIDKSKEIADFSCESSIEKFYEDENYSYFWKCIMNNYIIVKYVNGDEKLVSEALKDNDITFQDIDRFNIKYIKKPIERDIKRYEEIKESLSIAMDDFLSSTFIYHDDKNCNGFINGNVTSDTLIKNGYLNKEMLLDTDNKSYCRAIAKEYINFLDNSKDVCEMKYEIYISCKKYKTPGFDELEYRSFSNYKHESISY